MRNKRACLESITLSSSIDFTLKDSKTIEWIAHLTVLIAIVFFIFTAPAQAQDRPIEPIEDPGECPVQAPIRVANIDTLRHFEGLLGHCEANAIIESQANRANRPRVPLRVDDPSRIPAWDYRENQRDQFDRQPILANRSTSKDSDSTEPERAERQMHVSRDGTQIAIRPDPNSFAVQAAPIHGIGGPAPEAEVEAVLALRPQSYSTAFDDHISTAARNHGVDPLLLHAVIKQESRYRVHAVSSAGARGLMQVMPATGRMLGVSNPDNLFDAQTNIDAGARLLSQLWQTFDGNMDLVLAAYNAGEGAVRRYGRQIPPYRETQDYVRKVRGYYSNLAAENGLAVAF